MMRTTFLSQRARMQAFLYSSNKGASYTRRRTTAAADPPTQQRPYCSQEPPSAAGRDNTTSSDRHTCAATSGHQNSGWQHSAVAASRADTTALATLTPCTMKGSALRRANYSTAAHRRAAVADTSSRRADDGLSAADAELHEEGGGEEHEQQCRGDGKVGPREVHRPAHTHG